MWSRKLVRVCTAGFGVALLAGCGSSSTPPPSATTPGGTTSSSSPAVSPTEAPVSRAQLKQLNTQLKGIVLQAADLPAGWKGKRYKSEPGGAAAAAAMVKCVGAPSTDSHKVAEAHSEDFSLGNATISSAATSYPSQSDLDTDTAIARSPKLSKCYEQLVKKAFATSLPPGATMDSTSVKITPGSAGGPANVVATGAGVIKVSLNGQKIPAYLTVAFITGPLVEAQVETFNVGVPVPASIVKSLVATVATRAAKG